jgi:tetratricopeptide (TPR) repeat protein
MWLLLLSVWLAQSAGAAGVLDQARRALESREPEAAERLLAQALEADPGNAEAHYLLGVVRTESGRFDEARRSFERSIQIHSGLIPAHVGLAEAFRRQGQLPEAIRFLQDSLRRHPGEDLLLSHLGRLQAESGAFPEALGHLRRIPDYRAPPGHWETLGRTELSAGNLPEARAAFLRFLDENPESVGTLQTLSAIDLKLENSAASWEFIARARQLAPNSAKVVYAFAVVSLENHLVSEAINALRLLLLRDPDNPEYLLMLGNAVLESATEFSKAAEYFERYVEFRPDDPMGHMMLGYSQYTNRLYDEAERQFFRTLELDPDFIEVEYYLGMIAFNRNDDEEAMRRLSRVLADSDRHMKAHLALGKIHLRRGRFDEAVTSLTRALDLSGGNSDIHFNLSRAYAQLGDRETAEAHLANYRRFKDLETERETDSRRLRFSEILRPAGE